MANTCSIGSRSGRPCDYSGLSYAKLSEGSGNPWPCNDEHPHGSERCYADLNFATDPDYCESYGHDLLTGAAISAKDYRAKEPNGRAFLTPPNVFRRQKNRTRNIRSS